MAQIGEKLAALWFAYDALDELRQGEVPKSKLKVLTHNLANRLGLQKVEENFDEQWQTPTVSFLDFTAFLQSEVTARLKVSDAPRPPPSSALEEVCWFVCLKQCTRRDPATHRKQILPQDDTYKLWQLFNFYAERDADEKPLYPVVVHAEEVGMLLRRLLSVMGQPFDSEQFQAVAEEIPLFNFQQLLLLLETKYLNNLDQSVVAEGMKELQDEILVECIKKGYLVKKGHKMTTWKERWFVLSPRCLKYYTTKDCKEVKGEVPITSECQVNVMADKPGAKPYRFSVGTSRMYEISSPDSQTRSEWMAAIRTAVGCAKGQLSPQRAARETRRTERRQATQRRQQERQLMERTQSELEELRQARLEAETDARNEKQRLREEAANHEKQLAQEREEKHNAAALAQTEAQRLLAENENTLQQLKSEQLAHAETEALLLQEGALLEAKARQLREMEDMKKKLQELLQQEIQAKQDEEIVRRLQSQALEEEYKRREEMDRAREQLTNLLREEQQKREGLEEVRQHQEELLREEQHRLELLQRERQSLDKKLEAAITHLGEAEQAKGKMEEALKAKARERPVLQRTAHILPDDKPIPVVTHRDMGFLSVLHAEHAEAKQKRRHGSLDTPQSPLTPISPTAPPLPPRGHGKAGATTMAPQCLSSEDEATNDAGVASPPVDRDSFCLLRRPHRGSHGSQSIDRSTGEEGTPRSSLATLSLSSLASDDACIEDAVFAAARGDADSEAARDSPFDNVSSLATEDNNNEEGKAGECEQRRQVPSLNT